MKEVRTRFAPSPTGHLHIGGLRTALYAYLFARQKNGKLILRIEDTDRTRLVEGAVEQQINALSWAGVEFDEGPHIGGDFGPYVQSERLEIYKKYVDELVEKGYAYPCFCSKERLASVREEQMKQKVQPKYDKHCKSLSQEEIAAKIAAGESYVIRMAVPEHEDITFTDIVRGEITINTKDIDDQVLLKADGFPTYHLANVVDDHLMAITHVIRAEEWISSTPKHVLLYKMFGWDIPEFAHLPLLLNTDRSKLSKRQNDVSVSDYQEQGYLPEALVNFISLLGWNPGTDQEVFSIESLIEHFDLKKVHKAGAVFNREKLDWLNGAYIREMADNDYFAHAQKYLPAFIFGKFENTYIQNVINLEKTRIKKFNELAELVSNFFVDELEYEVEMLKWRKGDLAEAKERLTFMVSYLSDTDLALTPDNYEAIEETIKADIKAKDLGMGNTLWPLRVALSGREHSPSPFELLSVLGKEKSIERIQHAIAKLA